MEYASDSSIKPNSAGGIEDQRFGQAAEMHADQRGAEQELGSKIAVRDGIQAVGRRGVKTQLGCQGEPVDREGRAGQRPAAQGQDRASAAQACCSRWRSRCSGQKCDSHQWLSRIGWACWRWV